MTYPQINGVENNVQPRQTLHDVGRQRRSHSNTNRQSNNWRKTGQVRRIQADKQIVEQVCLLTGLEPLWSNLLASVLSHLKSRIKHTLTEPSSNRP